MNNLHHDTDALAEDATFRQLLTQLYAADRAYHALKDDAPALDAASESVMWAENALCHYIQLQISLALSRQKDAA